VPVLRGGGGGGGGGGEGDGSSSSTTTTTNAQVLVYASRVADVLRLSGLTPACLSRKKGRERTPAARRAALERAGVPLRADVGAREAAAAAAAGAGGGGGGAGELEATETVCLALHPALELELAEEEQGDQAPVLRAALQALRDTGRADAVPLASAAEVCRLTLGAAREAAGAAGLCSGGHAAVGSDDAGGLQWPPKLEVALPRLGDDAPEQKQQQQHQRRLLASGWCDRLHLLDSRCCPAHARWMLRLCPGPCYCGGVLGEHPPLPRLLEDAERALEARHQRSWAGRRGRRGGQQQPLLQVTWSPSPPQEPSAPERCCLFVAGLDPRLSAAQARGTILAALAPLLLAGGSGTTSGSPSFRVVLSKAPAGRTRGWARVTVSPATLADAAIAALSSFSEAPDHHPQPGRRRRRRRPAPLLLSASRSLGRADALFPLLPPQSRLRLRLDPVASFSVMDQPLAERVADLLLALCVATATHEEEEEEEAADGRSKRDHPYRRHHHAVDACACAGGSALALAKRFARVTAIELEPDRADDLAHNFAAAVGWRRRPALSEGEGEGEGGGGGDGRGGGEGSGTAAAPRQQRWWVEMRQPPEQEEEEEEEEAAREDEDDEDDHLSSRLPPPPPPRERRAVVACADALRLLLRPGSFAGPLPPGLEPGAPPVDVVFFDPPWGGPQYRADDDDDEDDEDDAQQHHQRQLHAECHAPVLMMRDGAAAADLLFAAEPLSATAAALLSSCCRMVALRLPAPDVDPRAFVAKVARRMEEEEMGGVDAVATASGRSLLLVLRRRAAAPASPQWARALRQHDCSELTPI
jgi:hypothetical protein